MYTKNNTIKFNSLPSNVRGSAKVIVLTVLATLIILVAGAVISKKDTTDLLSPFMTPAEPLKQKPLYLPLNKFVISVESDTVIYYLMVEMTLATASDDKLIAINHYLPVIRNSIVSNLSQRDFKSMRSYLKDLNLLQSELLASLKEVLTKHDIGDAVDEVLITKLVIQ